MVLEGPKGGQVVAYTGHDSWAGVAHDISNEAYTENRCSGSDTRPTVALGDSSVLSGSTLLLPPVSRRVTQEGNTLLSSPGLTKVGAGRNPGPLDGSKSGGMEGLLVHDTRERTM